MESIRIKVLQRISEVRKIQSAKSPLYHIPLTNGVTVHVSQWLMAETERYCGHLTYKNPTQAAGNDQFVSVKSSIKKPMLLDSLTEDCSLDFTIVAELAAFVELASQLSFEN